MNHNYASNLKATKKVQEMICSVGVWASKVGTDDDIKKKIDYTLTLGSHHTTWGFRVRNRSSIKDFTIRAYIPATGNSCEYVSWMQGVYPQFYAYIAADTNEVKEFWILDVNLIINTPRILFNTDSWVPNTDGKTGFITWSYSRLYDSGALLYRWPPPFNQETLTDGNSAGGYSC